MQRRTFILGTASVALGLSPWLSAAAPASTRWEKGQALPINIQEIYPVVHQRRLYVAGGIAAKFGAPYFTDACFSYDPSTDQWRAEPDLPKSLHHAALVSTGERLFLVGGFHGSYTNVWQMQDTVYELVAGAWQAVSTLPKPQAEGVLSTAADGAIHLVTGQSPKGKANGERSDHREITDHYRWLPGAANWEAVAPIPTARNSATGGWVGEHLIVTGGRTASGNLSATEIYSSDEDRWRVASPLPLPQAGTASVVVDDGLIVFGGEMFTPEAKVFKELWRYSISRDTWTPLADMPTPRHGIGAGRFGNRIYVIGGATEPSGNGTSNLNEVLVY